MSSLMTKKIPWQHTYHTCTYITTLTQISHIHICHNITYNNASLHTHKQKQHRPHQFKHIDIHQKKTSIIHACNTYTNSKTYLMSTFITIPPLFLTSCFSSLLFPPFSLFLAPHIIKLIIWAIDHIVLIGEFLVFFVVFWNVFRWWP